MTSPSREELEGRISLLAARYRLSASAVEKLSLFAACLIEDPLAPTPIRDPLGVVDRHLADSLVALELESIRAANQVLDLGSGAGLPGLPLAAVLPETSFVLLESASRKCAFIERTATRCGISNVQVLPQRAETYEEGLGRYDVVTVRAVARLDVTAEYAAPLLRVGGMLIAWGGKRSADAEAAAGRAADELGLGAVEVVRVEPFDTAQHRHLYLMLKVGETSSRFPRRPGVALKRPLGSSGASSDRSRR